MKKMLGILLALCLMIPVAAFAQDMVTLGQINYAAHGDKCFAVISVAMQGDKIAAARIDEFQYLSADGAVGVPNSDGAFGQSYPEGKVLASKRDNSETYSANMAANGATNKLADNYMAIEAYVAGKTIAELEAATQGQTPETMVDAVAGCTLVDTLGYVQGVIEAAKAAQ